ncbi:MAG TPA: SurA N-terminal domain-containing protein [Candidatus Saccharimonadales bacterium]
MKKTKRIPKVTRPFKKRPGAEERLKEAFANVPNITNETVAEHREDVLAGARKFIYPLKHSRRRVVVISSTIFVAALVVFLAYVSVSLYRFQSTSGFLYGVTKVIPFPIAKAGDSWVSYNSYLFELRHYMHYYETQQGVDFDSESGQEQLAVFKKQVLEQVSNDAYVKQLADKHNVRVSNRAVDNQVALVRSQNRLGTSNEEFREVLNEFWGWDENDFKRSLKQQMLAAAVVAKLDTETVKQANDALTQLKSGADFATLASQISEDENTKGNGGQYPGAIDRSNADIPAAVINQLFKLQPGQTSEVINTGYSLEIVKVNGVQDGRVQASHIAFNFKPIEDYIKPLKKQHKPQNYIKL